MAGLSQEQRAIPHCIEGRMSEAGSRLHWARAYPTGIGALDNSARGVWTVTNHGRGTDR